MAGEKTQTTKTSSNLDSVLSGILTPEDIASIRAQVAAATAKKTTSKKPGTVLRPTIYSKTKADSTITAQFQSILKRKPTKTELKLWRQRLETAQKNNPSVQTYKVVGGKAVQSTKTGLDVKQWLTQNILSDATYAPEIAELTTVDEGVLKRQADKEIYDAAITAAKGDPIKIAKINSTTSYGLALGGIKARIKNAADKAGAVVDEATLAQYAQEAYDTNQDTDAYTLQQFIDSKLTFGPDKAGFYKGAAGKAISELQDVARANGLDLNKAFGSSLPSWVQAINKGEDIETYKRLIRGVAKLGLPDKVGALLDQGADLETIYSPYRRQMAALLETTEDSISLDDPLLRAAYGPDKEMSIYDFQRAVRKDPRWQYTDNARDEMAGTAMELLRNFGFMG
jgi:hypothetical protein